MPSRDFLQQLKSNNEVFAAFRTHRMQNDIAELMTDENGNLRSFNSFAKDALNYTDHQNRAWLQTEYDTAVRRAHQAADWQQFESEKDVLPNLEWEPSTSATPGADHQVFWGTIAPVDDPFWNEHRPGDRWNCKCTLSATDKPANTPPKTTSPNDMPARGLENNPGKDGKLFSESHPYMPSSCSSCPFSPGKLKALLADLVGKNDCNKCLTFDKKIDNQIITKAQQVYNAYNPDKYEKTFFDNKTGGFLVTERQRIHSAHQNKQEKAKFEKEREMCLVFAKAGNKIEHLSEVAGISSSDVMFNGVKADLKRTGSFDQIVKYAKLATRKQGAQLVLFQFDNYNAKFDKEIKNLIKENIHGRYFITGNGKCKEIKDF